jgi:hypothetical protein
VTEEKLREIVGELKTAIDSERAYLEPVLRALGEGHNDLRRDVDTLADRLAKVTAALVDADGALVQRVARLEQPTHVDYPEGVEPARRGLLSRLTRRK